MVLRKFTFLIFIVSLILLASRCRNGATHSSHDFASTKTFLKLTREEQVKKCGECHKEIYEQEMLGPHANAFTNLQAHIDFVLGDSYPYKPYKDIIANNKDACIGCHASKNIYESVFVWNGNDFQPGKRLFGKKKKPTPRAEQLRTTGIDCITCHFDGKAVVTGKGFTPSDQQNCPGYCSPIASNFFSSNANCAPCHMGQFKDTEAFNTANNQSMSCAGCHNEKANSGKLTHYTYWAHNPESKQLPEHLNLFTGIEALWDSTENIVRVVWRNLLTPHEASHCTELAAFIEVFSNDEVVATDTIRLNRKESHVSNMREKIQIDDFPGITGLVFKGMNDSIVKTIPIAKTSEELAPGYQVKITGIKKEQYWLSDSINTLYYSKSFTL